MYLTLLVLAAGMGSRYGGLKQVDPVGPSGETILDYAVFDAKRAGFARVVFVIRREMEAVFRKTVATKYAGKIPVDFVFQGIEDLPEGFSPPAGRDKPWGTGHAVWCARAVLQGPFAVINADDFYGMAAFSRLAMFLGNAEPGKCAMVGFRLANTLSENGPVSRGICYGKDGKLDVINEETAITRADIGAGLRFSGDEIVSMNFWGFGPGIFAGLDADLRAFLAAHGSDPKAEFYLPSAASALIAAGTITVDVLFSEDQWFGITYQEDRPQVVSAIEKLVSDGLYPGKLFA
jgi:dTDP-glucose pyrophosphorylase